MNESTTEEPTLNIPNLTDVDIPTPRPPVESILANIFWKENIYPDVRATPFDRSDKDLLKSLYGDAIRMCRERIDPVYIKYAFKKFQHGILLNDHESGRRLGFCLIKIKRHNNTNNKSSVSIRYSNEMHVLLVCARADDVKVGPVLMYEIDKYAAANDVNNIEMEAAYTELIPVYERYGYTHIKFPDNYVRLQSGRLPDIMLKHLKPMKIVRRKDGLRSTRRATHRGGRRRWTRSRKPQYNPGFHF